MGCSLDIQQLCYVSQAVSTQPKILQELRDILTEARHFNHLHDIQGVLYYADGYFFQFLEGPREHIKKLVDKLVKDPRHTHFNFFHDYEFEKGAFSDWSMKYINRNSEVQTYVKSLGYEKFSPLSLQPEERQQLLKLLCSARNEV